MHTHIYHLWVLLCLYLIHGSESSMKFCTSSRYRQCHTSKNEENIADVEMTHENPQNPSLTCVTGGVRLNINTNMYKQQHSIDLKLLFKILAPFRPRYHIFTEDWEQEAAFDGCLYIRLSNHRNLSYQKKARVVRIHSTPPWHRYHSKKETMPMSRLAWSGSAEPALPNSIGIIFGGRM